jgi:hypothetical protein
MQGTKARARSQTRAGEEHRGLQARTEVELPEIG